MILLAMLLSSPAIAHPPCDEGFEAHQTKIHPHVILHVHRCTAPRYRLHALEVRLDSPHLSFIVNPQGTGRMTTSGFAERYGVLAAVNGGYRSDEGGYTVSSGDMWTGPGDTEASGVLGLGSWNGVTGNTHVEIRSPEEILDHVPGWMSHAVSGHPMVLEGGHPVPTEDHRYIDRHPRTAAGISADGDVLYLVTVDGRQPGWSLGMSTAQLAEVFIGLGAHRAINLDGGGSTTIVVPSLGGRINRTCARKGDERPVLNHVGIVAGGLDWAWPGTPALAQPSMWWIGEGLGSMIPRMGL